MEAGMEDGAVMEDGVAAIMGAVGMEEGGAGIMVAVGMAEEGKEEVGAMEAAAEGTEVEEEAMEDIMADEILV